MWRSICTCRVCMYRLLPCVLYVRMGRGKCKLLICTDREQPKKAATSYMPASLDALDCSKFSKFIIVKTGVRQHSLAAYARSLVPTHVTVHTCMQVKQNPGVPNNMLFDKNVHAEINQVPEPMEAFCWRCAQRCAPKLPPPCNNFSAEPQGPGLLKVSRSRK